MVVPDRPHSYGVKEVEKDPVTGEDLVKVFVYGTLKKGYGNDHYLKNSKCLGEGELYQYQMRWGQGFPCIYRTNQYGVQNCVHGEVYQVNQETLAALDRLEGVPHFYQRERAHVAMHGYCWVYVQKKPTETSWYVVPNGRWKGAATEKQMFWPENLGNTKIPDYKPAAALPPPPPKEPTYDVGALLWPDVEEAKESSNG